MNIEAFVSLLFVGSILTSLLTEGMKKMLENLASNAIAAIISVFVGGLIGFYYCDYMLTDASIMTIVLVILSFVVGSWLCAMLGYDKVMQYIGQIKEIKARKE